MAKFETITNTIEFAKEIAYEVETRPEPPTSTDILAALCVMDSQLKGSGEDVRSMFAFNTALLLPDYFIEVELMTDQEVAESLVASSIVKARADHFEWAGSVVMSGFGLRLYGVDFVEPQRRHEATAFVPLHAIDLRLAA